MFPQGVGFLVAFFFLFNIFKFAGVVDYMDLFCNGTSAGVSLRGGNNLQSWGVKEMG